MNIWRGARPKSRSLLNVTSRLLDLEHLVQARHGEAAAGEVHADEPSAYEVGEMVEEVGIRHAVDTCESCKEEEEGVGYVAESEVG